MKRPVTVWSCRVLVLHKSATGPTGIGFRVNALHPDAVFDTGIWTQDALERSAKRYGMSVEEYKTRNLLGCAIGSTDVANAVVTLCDTVLRATTGAQIPVDGGNDRVI